MKKRTAGIMLGIMLTASLIAVVATTKPQKRPVRVHRQKKKEPGRQYRKIPVSLIQKKLLTAKKRIPKNRIRKVLPQKKSPKKIQTARTAKKQFRKTEKRSQYFCRRKPAGKQTATN